MNFVRQSPQTPIAIVRPSIVESSIAEPFLGWNEGINTSASLSYLLGTYFRQLPTNERKCLDIVPVDLVCRGMTLIAAALMARRHAAGLPNCIFGHESVQHGPLDRIDRAWRIAATTARKMDSSTGCELKFDTIPVSKARYEKLSAPAQKAVVQAIQRGVEPFGLQMPTLARRERELDTSRKADRALRAFHPAQRSYFRGRQCRAALGVAAGRKSAPISVTTFAALDWWDYWINIHIPALRKWCYPLIEGRAPEAAAAAFRASRAGYGSGRRRRPACGAGRVLITQPLWPSS